MTDQKENMNTDGNNDCYLLRSPTPEDHGQLGARNGYKLHRAISPFRTTLEKVLVVVTFILFIVCIVFVVLFAVEKSKASKSVSNNEVDSDEFKDTSCAYSDEAMRVGLSDFVNRVKKAYYEYNRMAIEFEPTFTVRDLSIRLKERYLPLNVTPAFLKQTTDTALSLLDEIKKKEMDENIMKPREVKAIQQVKLFLRTVFGNPYDQNFYDGDWLLGPNHFCWQNICDMGVGIYNYGLYVKPENVSEFEEVLRKLGLVGVTLEQYISNMKLGIKVGMVRSESSCRAGLDAFAHKFKKISKQNNPKDILDEWFVEHFRNASFIEIIPKAEKQSWLDSKGETMLESIDNVLVEDIGRHIVKMMDYLKNDHIRHCLPHSVPSGMSSLPVDYIYEDGVKTSTRTTKKLPLTGQPLDGRTIYVNTLPYFTTSDITPDEINKIGEEGLKALYPQAVEVAKNVTGEADSEIAIREFKKKLNESRQFFNSEPFPANESDSGAHKRCSDIEQAQIHCPKRWETMMTWSNFCRQTMGMLAPKLIPLFYHTGKKITVPNCPVEMSPDFNPSSGAQSFEHSGPTCHRPSYYNLPFFLDNYGPKFTEWSVTAHEGWPGHHTQVQGEQEYFHDKCGGELQWLHAMSSSTFFEEGWALYAENPLISEDTDTYIDEPLQKYGMLQWQIWRALRLIVDTGLHHRGMNRSTALELFAKYAWDETELSQKEITRYQGTPGQATTYMLGQQKIVQLRKYCESELGEQFNKQEFHYQILSHGPVPEAYLDKHIKKYVKCALDEVSDISCDGILNASTKENDYSSKLEHKLLPRPSRLRYA